MIPKSCANELAFALFVAKLAHDFLKQWLLCERSLFGERGLDGFLLGLAALTFFQNDGVQFAAIHEHGGGPIQEYERDHRRRQTRIGRHIIRGEFGEIPPKIDAADEPKRERDEDTRRDIAERAPPSRQPFMRD